MLKANFALHDVMWPLMRRRPVSNSRTEMYALRPAVASIAIMWGPCSGVPRLPISKSSEGVLADQGQEYAEHHRGNRIEYVGFIKIDIRLNSETVAEGLNKLLAPCKDY